MRLVVDKSRKKHIPSSRDCERIDFNNYIQGENIVLAITNKRMYSVFLKWLNDDEI